MMFDDTRATWPTVRRGVRPGIPRSRGPAVHVLVPEDDFRIAAVLADERRPARS